MRYESAFALLSIQYKYVRECKVVPLWKHKLMAHLKNVLCIPVEKYEYDLAKFDEK